MKHDWVVNENILGNTRKCSRCGVEQQYTSDTWYMRTIRRYWWPEEHTRGKCSGAMLSSAPEADRG